MSLCAQRTQLSCFMSRELSPSERVAFEEHLVDCDLCARDLGDFLLIDSYVGPALRRARQRRARRRLVGLLMVVGFAVLAAVVLLGATS